MKPEEQYRNKIDKHLEIYFQVEREVVSTNGKRIDYVLKCNHSNALFGLEVKNEDHKRGNDYVKFLKQASQYNNELWLTKFYPEPTKIPIFIAPAISNRVKQLDLNSCIKINNVEYFKPYHPRNHSHCNGHGLISGLLDIGEIRKWHWRGLFSFMYHNFEIWSSHDNPEWRFKSNNYNKHFNYINLNIVK